MSIRIMKKERQLRVSEYPVSVTFCGKDESEAGECKQKEFLTVERDFSHELPHWILSNTFGSVVFIFKYCYLHPHRVDGKGGYSEMKNKFSFPWYVAELRSASDERPVLFLAYFFLYIKAGRGPRSPGPSRWHCRQAKWGRIGEPTRLRPHDFAQFCGHWASLCKYVWQTVHEVSQFVGRPCTVPEMCIRPNCVQGDWRSE